MKKAKSIAHGLSLSGLAFAVFSSGCAFMEPSAERWTAPPVGSSWDMMQRNTGSYGKDVTFRVTRGDGVWQGAQVVTISNSLGMTTMTAPSGHWIAMVGRDGKPVTSWSPPLGFDYPLTVGKTWTTSYRMTMHARGNTIAYELSCKVESHEKVGVKAGEFDAFKVVCSTNIGNEETYWTNPDMGVFIKTSLKRTDKSPFGPGTQETELVSAPALR
jgi:hypothetical protein